MTDTQVRPKRFPWVRLLLVMAVLIPLAVVAWWNWPRGDSRFVGRWTFDNPNDSTIFEMRANGTATFYVSDYPVTWYWATWDGNYSFGWPSAYPTGVDRARSLSSWSHECLNLSINTCYEQYKIISVTDDVIEMKRWIGDDKITRLYRVRDAGQ